MTRRPNPVLFLLLGVLVVAAGYMLLWKPRADDLASVRAENETLSQDLTAARAAVRPGTATTNATGTATDAGAFASAIPPTPELPNLLRQLQSIGTDSGVNVSAVTPSPAAGLSTVGGGTIGVTLTGTGTKTAIDTYVSRLGGLPRLFVVDKVNVTASTSSGAGPDTEAAPAAGTLQLQLAGRVFTTLAPATAAGQSTTATTASPATTVAHG